MIRILRKISNWYFSKGALPYWIILVIDLVIVMASAYVGAYFVWGGGGVTNRFWSLFRGMFVAEVFYLLIFRYLHTYTGVIRFSTLKDIAVVLLSNLLGAAVTYLLGRIFHALGWHYVQLLSLKGCVALFFFCSIAMSCLRVVVKLVYDGYIRDDKARRVFIYGVKDGGAAIASSLMNEHPQRFCVSGFVSPDGSYESKWLMGVQVRRVGPNLVKHMRDEHANILVVSPNREDEFRANAELVDTMIQSGIKIMMFTGVSDWDENSQLNNPVLREVDIEELLPREKIEVDLDTIGQMLKNKCIMITGAAGSIGSEIVRQVATFGPSKLVLVDQAETPMHDILLMMNNQFSYLNSVVMVTSITNKTHMEQLFRQHRPEYVFHAAAYKHVPMMEDNPAVAVQNNVYGTRVVADLAVKYGAKKFVMVSTDKAVNPTNVMGCSKRICEIYCQSLNKAIVEGQCPIELAEGLDKPCTQFVTTRFGNVLGSNGSVIPIFKEQIKKGGPVTVTHPDIIRFFMLIPEACRLVLEAGTMGMGGEIFVFDMGEPVRIADLAKRMIKLSGAQNIEIKFTGLRHGEKLYEEVLNEKEQTKETHHPKIRIANVREYEYAEALRNEERLLAESFTHDDMAIVKIMKEIVPEYKSQSSKYEVLDGKTEDR
ncbi:MAG: polysaccharide biosynthesis protein [Bacteroidales bacterium]|nr:polysaccharide biosynthesis protein [Bacteroidales bacterium]